MNLALTAHCGPSLLVVGSVPRSVERNSSTCRSMMTGAPLGARCKERCNWIEAIGIKRSEGRDFALDETTLALQQSPQNRDLVKAALVKLCKAFHKQNGLSPARPGLR